MNNCVEKNLNPEKRYNNGKNYTKDEHGRFTGSTGGGKSDKTVEKSAESGTINLKNFLDGTNDHRFVTDSTIENIPELPLFANKETNVRYREAHWL